MVAYNFYIWTNKYAHVVYKRTHGLSISVLEHKPKYVHAYKCIHTYIYTLHIHTYTQT